MSLVADAAAHRDEPRRRSSPTASSSSGSRRSRSPRSSPSSRSPPASCSASAPATRPACRNLTAHGGFVPEGGVTILSGVVDRDLRLRRRRDRHDRRGGVRRARARGRARDQPGRRPRAGLLRAGDLPDRLRSSRGTTPSSASRRSSRRWTAIGIPGAADIMNAIVVTACCRAGLSRAARSPWRRRRRARRCAARRRWRSCPRWCGSSRRRRRTRRCRCAAAPDDEVARVGLHAGAGRGGAAGALRPAVERRSTEPKPCPASPSGTPACARPTR